MTQEELDELSSRSWSFQRQEKFKPLERVFSDLPKQAAKEIERLREEVRQARNKALEEAAARADLWPDFHTKDAYAAGFERGRNDAAAAIRALKEPKP
jgi:hypothetical protein